ncbi:MAG TPA: hypothetical protein VLI55_11425, partial [Bryobacteraceae bacterium]|nr:hypothetical protein [Bryobacteraceae bacterium]
PVMTPPKEYQPVHDPPGEFCQACQGLPSEARANNSRRPSTLVATVGPDLPRFFLPSVIWKSGFYTTAS